MPRSREFQPDTVLDAALDLFWRKGYKACSMADVVKKTGVARYGLYQAFQDKDQLYRAALKRYSQIVTELMLKPFCGQRSKPDFTTLEQHFEHMLNELAADEHQGCFLHQAAIERAGEDPEVDAIVQEFFERSKHHYREMIKQGLKLGQIREQPIEDLVVYVIGIQRAVIAMSKQHCSLQERRNYVRCALELLKP